MLAYIIIPILVLATLACGGYLNSLGMAWYSTLQKPTITPPPYVFQYAWMFIGLCTALSIILIHKNLEPSLRKKIIYLLFMINAGLNIGWTYLFFTEHLMKLALLDSIALLLNTALIMLLAAPASSTAAVLLLPYVSWLCFAIILNWQFIQLN